MEIRNIVKKLPIIVPVLCLSLFVVVSPTFAAAPDGLGPWADTVVSFHQGVMKNGLPVPAARSDPTAALGVAENTPTIDSTFFSLGFGGDIVLGFDNGISTGAMVIEATIEPGYPDETAKVEMSQNGTTWVMAGNVSQDGTVTKPAQLTCAKFVRITDTSIPANYPDAIADGYDVDGVKATGTACTSAPGGGPQGRVQPTPTPTLTLTSTQSPTQAPTQSPTQAPTTVSSNTSSNSSSGGGSSSGSSSSNSSSSSNGSTACTSSGVSSVPNIILAKRLSPTSIFVSWGPNAGLNNFIVQYGFQNGNWQFSTKVSGFSTTINNLPANQSIWIEVAATDNCAIGAYGKSVLVGGTIATNSPGFPNTGVIKCSTNPKVPCFPNTGGIGLPNTGFNPTGNIFSNIQMSIQYIFSLIQDIKL